MKLTIDGKDWQWPELDEQCRRVVFTTVEDMRPAIAIAAGRNCAVQAGGNCGVWAAWLAERFDKVVTVEPDPLNYWCLTQNVPKNVLHKCAAFGDAPGMMGMDCDPKNVGAHQMAKGTGVKVITIDSLKLDACDYLCLDIEGFEMNALRGAVETIKKFRPVIQVEDKGLSDRYGTAKGDIEKWLEYHFKYRVYRRIHRDIILAA